MKRFLLFLLFLCSCASVASAFESTSYTFSTDARKNDLRIVQDAYLPDGMYKTLGLKSPQDLYVHGDKMYIADTGNRRVLTVELSSGQVTVLDFKFSQPVCVAADDAGRIYVADYKKNCAYRFSARGELEQVFERPESPAYGVNNLFKPQSLAPDGNGGLYIVADGASNGIVQMNAKGEFLGFFASNSAYIALKYKLYDIFLNDEQMAQYGLGIPGKFSMVLRGNDGLIYALRAGAGCEVQKLSYTGVNLFANKRGIAGLAYPADMAMGTDGSIFVLHQSGYITQMTREGVLLYRFGGPMMTEAREGLIQTPAGIGVDDKGKVYVMDKVSGFIHVFAPTASQELTSAAITNYYDGDYQQAGALLDEVLNYNNHSYYARLYRGKVYMHTGDYEAAAEQFRIAEEKTEYSEAFWEIRNAFLMKNAGWVLGGAAAVIVLLLIVSAVRKPKREEYSSYLQSVPLKPAETLGFKCLKRAVFHPIDTAYEIKRGHMGGYLPASILVLLVLAVVMLRVLCSGYIFSANAEDFPLALCCLGGIGGVLLFAISNYFITSINDGESTLKMVFSVVAYAFTPMLFALPVMTLLCHVLTLQEALIVNTLTVALVGLCVVNLSVMLMEIHGYGLKQYLKSILLTLLFMVLIILVMSLIFLLARQMVESFIQIWTEVVIRE